MVKTIGERRAIQCEIQGGMPFKAYLPDRVKACPIARHWFGYGVNPRRVKSSRPAIGYVNTG
jgi:hypothetical protein